MARSAILLEEKENEFFHKNYYYMWKKLNTAPYYVSGFGEMPEWIKDEYLLPSYVNLSKCMNPRFVPSMNIVNKIVQFYNANIKPEVDTYQFLHADLSDSDGKRTVEGVLDLSKYTGLYTCYYYAGIDDEKHVYGAYLRLVQIGEIVSAYFITGISNNEDLNTPELLALVCKNDIELEEFAKYKKSLPLSKRRVALYKGGASMIPGMMTIQLQNMEKEGNLLTLRTTLSTGVDDSFLGSIGLLTMISNDFNLQILKIGIENSDIKELKTIDFKDERLLQFLNIKKTANEHIHLALKENNSWNDFLIENSEN